MNQIKEKIALLSIEEQTAFNELAIEKDVNPETGECNNQDKDSPANSEEARKTRLERMIKNAKERVEMDNENRLQEFSPLLNIRNEKITDAIKVFRKELWHRRKTYISSENTEPEEVRFPKVCFSKRDIESLEKLIKLYETDDYRYKAFKLIVEGLKYPQKEIKNLCYQYFKDTINRGMIDAATFMLILEKEYVPKGAWRLLILFQGKFKGFGMVLKPMIERHASDERTQQNWEKIKDEEDIKKLFPNEENRDIWKLYCE